MRFAVLAAALFAISCRTIAPPDTQPYAIVLGIRESNPALRDPAVIRNIRDRGFNLAVEREKTPL